VCDTLCDKKFIVLNEISFSFIKFIINVLCYKIFIIRFYKRKRDLVEYCKLRISYCIIHCVVSSVNPFQPIDAMWRHTFHLSLICMSFAQ
jgi:hypothetical protein